MKKVFTMFDTDADGVISEDDLRATFIAVGKEAPPEQLQQMLQEVSQVDFQSISICHDDFRYKYRQCSR